jgi:hypothetical protein
VSSFAQPQNEKFVKKAKAMGEVTGAVQIFQVEKAEDMRPVLEVWYYCRSSTYESIVLIG